MKKLFVILTVAVGAAFMTVSMTSCDTDIEFNGERVRKRVIDNIFVAPNGWETGPGYMYADIDMPEITPRVLSGGTYETYFKFLDGRDPIQAPLPYTVYNKEGNGFEWEYTLRCEYTEGSMRIILSTSDFEYVDLNETWYFRTVIYY